MGPSRGDRPHSVTILMAKSVAPERSLAAPVEASPTTRILRGAAAEADGQGVEQVALGVEVSLIDRELFGDSEGAAGGQDRDLGHRVGVLREEGDERVPGFVDGHGPFLFGEERIGRVRVGPAGRDPWPRRCLGRR